MRKSALILLLCFIMIIVLGCTYNPSNKAVDTTGTTDKKVDTVESTTKTDNSKASDITKEPVSTKAPVATKAPEPTEVDKSKYTIENEIVIDNDYCVFTIVRADEDNFWGPTLKVLCENKTSDQALMFSVDDVSVNGYMADPFWATSVPAGKKENSELNFPATTLDQYGINTLDEVTFKLSVHEDDDDDWSPDQYVDEFFTVYPTGKSAEEIVIPQMPSDGKETVVVDNDKIKFVILQTYKDEIWGYTVSAYLENKTDKTLMYSWDDVSVNGFMVDPFWATTVAPGKRTIAGISFSDTQFEENDITEVSEIEYTLEVSYDDDWEADALLDKVFTYKP